MTTPIESWEKMAEEMMLDVWFRKLDELPFAMKHGREEHGQKIIAEAQKILAENIRTKLEEAYRKGREDAVTYINIRASRGQGYAEATCVYEDALQEVLREARHAGEVTDKL